MGDINILFDKKSPQLANTDIGISAEFDGIIDYKVIIGNMGIWSTIKDFSDQGKCVWTPDKNGKYMVMIQGKKRNSDKPFDYLAKEEYIIGKREEEKRLIKDVVIEKKEYTEGEKINIDVVTKEKDVLYRFSRKVKNNWELIKDYTSESNISYSTCSVGSEEILIECKRVDSAEHVDDFRTLKFNVKEKGKAEITDFKCLTEELLLNEELVFKVESSCDESRPLLFKFIRIDEDGKVSCIQDFSSRKVVSFQESQEGKYRLLCYMKDIFSKKDFDDRAIMMYEVKPYNDVVIKSFSSDVKSPQMSGTNINFKVNAEGGRELVYRYKIDGPVADDSCYTRQNEFLWNPETKGQYRITLYVKDISFKGDYEDKKTILFDIDKKADKPVRILDVITDQKKESLVGRPVNIRAIAEGGTSLEYSFIIYKDGLEIERINYDKTNWINFTPKECGEYEVVIWVKDKFSREEYDVKISQFIKVKDYLPGNIDYVLLPCKAEYLVGDDIEFEVIVQNTRNILINYITKINGHVVEETGFITNKKLKIKPKCSGKYTFEIYAKNIKCVDDFDAKKEFSLYVHEATPVTDTKIRVDEDIIKQNEEVTFRVESNGGKDVCYEFYIMEKGNWIKAQDYSKKRYYTFIPFSKGYYRVMVLAKSYYKRVNYEDYAEFEFDV